MADNELFGNSEQLNDLISRQAAIEAADSIIERDTSGNNDVVRAMTAWKEYIKALPTVDAVLVVRCRDCKWYGYYSCEMGGNNWMRDGNGFCDRGVRKDGDNHDSN